MFHPFFDYDVSLEDIHVIRIRYLDTSAQVTVYFAEDDYPLHIEDISHKDAEYAVDTLINSINELYGINLLLQIDEYYLRADKIRWSLIAENETDVGVTLSIKGVKHPVLIQGGKKLLRDGETLIEKANEILEELMEVGDD